MSGEALSERERAEVLAVVESTHEAFVATVKKLAKRDAKRLETKAAKGRSE